MEQNSEFSQSSEPNVVVPAARPLQEFSMEYVGDRERVLFDPVRMEYHTLNAPAFAVWMQCDGNSAVEEIREALRRADLPMSDSDIELAVAQLTDANLLQVDKAWVAPAGMLPTRRGLLKGVAAGIAGAGVLPIVKSITVPDSASAASGDRCFGTGDCSGSCPSGSMQCVAGFCHCV